jgi:hypothetical protein
MRHIFRLRELSQNGSPNRRYHKVRYTAALRLGVVLESHGGEITLEFNGERTSTVAAHEGNEAFLGTIYVGIDSFPNVILIARPTERGSYSLISFWPVSQHPDAHKSYTDPLVDTALDGTPYKIEIVASSMHEAFKMNAGASPATLMKLLYESETSSLREAAEKYGALLQESFDREALLATELEGERVGRRRAEADAAAARDELERLRAQSYRPAPIGTSVEKSDVVTLLKVAEGHRGRFNQRAILLHMSDGSERANNWENNYSSRLQYAKKLEGKRVRTDSWNGFDPKKWFQNIYLAE